MKKLIFGGLFLALIGTAIVGCKKEQFTQSTPNENTTATETKNGPGYWTDGNMLIFNTVKDYELSIFNLTTDEENTLIGDITALNYTSYAEHLINQGELGGQVTDLIGDNMLNAVLNKARIVRIENYIYRVNMQTEKVFVLPVANISEIDDLINEDRSNKNIRQFSTGDDVIYLAEANDPGEKCGGIGGGVYPCYANVYDGQIIKTFSNGVVWRLNPFVRFFRAGVYFKLSSQFEVWRFATANSTSNGQIVNNISGNDLSIEMFVRGPEGWWKKRPCNSGSIGTRSSGLHYSEGTYGNYTKTVYSGTRNLNGYYFFVQGRARYSNGSVTTASPYGGRNINSPY